MTTILELVREHVSQEAGGERLNVRSHVYAALSDTQLAYGL
jgi:hypothetical protein